MTTVNAITAKLVFSFHWSRKIVSALVFLVGLLLTNPAVYAQELEKDFSLAEYLMKLELDRYASSVAEERPELYKVKQLNLRRIDEEYHGYVAYVLHNETHYNPSFLFIDDKGIFNDFFGKNLMYTVSVGSEIGAVRYSSNNRNFKWSRVSFPDFDTKLTTSGVMDGFHVYSLRYAEKDGVPFGPYNLHIGASRASSVYIRDKEKKLHSIGTTPCIVRLYRGTDAEFIANRSDIVPLVQKIRISKPDDLMYFDVGSSHVTKGTLTIRTVSNANVVLEGIVQGKTNVPIKLSHPLPSALYIRLHSGNVNRYMTIQIPDAKASEVFVDFDIEPRWVNLEIPEHIKDFRVQIKGLHNRISDREYVLFGTDIPIIITRPTYFPFEHIVSASQKERITLPVRFMPDHPLRRRLRSGSAFIVSSAILPPPDNPVYLESDYIYEFRFGSLLASARSGLLGDLSFGSNFAVSDTNDILSTYSSASLRGGVGYRVWIASVAYIYAMAYGHLGMRFLWTEGDASNISLYAEPELALGLTMQGHKNALFFEAGIRPLSERFNHPADILSFDSYIPVVTIGYKKVLSR